MRGGSALGGVELEEIVSRRRKALRARAKCNTSYGERAPRCVLLGGLDGVLCQASCEEDFEMASSCSSDFSSSPLPDSLRRSSPRLPPPPPPPPPPPSITLGFFFFSSYFSSQRCSVTSTQQARWSGVCGRA